MSGVHIWGVKHPSRMLKGTTWEGYTQRLLYHPIFDVRLLKRCSQKNAYTLFGTLDTFWMTEFIVTCLKCAEHRGWMQSRQSPRRAIETGDLSLPGLTDFVSNIIRMWSLVISNLKKTGKKDSAAIVLLYAFFL